MHIGISRFTARFSTVLVALVVISAATRGASAADLLGVTAGYLSQESPVHQKDGETNVAPELRTKVAPEGAVTESKGTATSAASQSTSPSLTPGKKFNYFARSSFFPPTPYALSIASGVFSEATDKDHHRHMSAGDFMVDSMTHAARSFTFRVTANFFEKFAYAAAFKQDPRYFRSDRTGVARIGYAVSRVFITRSDGGKNQFNASFLFGGLTTAGISNAWSRPEDRTLSSTMGRFGTHVGYKALANVIRELFGRR